MHRPPENPDPFFTLIGGDELLAVVVEPDVDQLLVADVAGRVLDRGDEVVDVEVELLQHGGELVDRRDGEGRLRRERLHLAEREAGRLDVGAEELAAGRARVELDALVERQRGPSGRGVTHREGRLGQIGDVGQFGVDRRDERGHRVDQLRRHLRLDDEVVEEVLDPPALVDLDVALLDVAVDRLPVRGARRRLDVPGQDGPDQRELRRTAPLAGRRVGQLERVAERVQRSCWRSPCRAGMSWTSVATTPASTASRLRSRRRTARTRSTRRRTGRRSSRRTS